MLAVHVTSTSTHPFAPAEAKQRPTHLRTGDFGLARSFQDPLRPLSENGCVVTIWCAHHGCDGRARCEAPPTQECFVAHEPG